MEISVLEDHREKWKKRKSQTNNFQSVEKQWNMKMSVVPIVVGALGTVLKVLVKDKRGKERIEIIQITALLRLARIPRKVRETWGVLLSLIPQ